MLRRIFSIIVISVLLVPAVFAQSSGGTDVGYSPYSIYGIGDIQRQGTAYNKSMGGVGIATRNKRFINILNPASASAKDSLSFMADIGVYQKNTIYRQGNLTSGNNLFNMYNFILSFPIYRTSGMTIGITPFSDVGYDFSSKVTDPGIIGETNIITNSASGAGSIYQAFAAAGATFWDRFSVGAELIYYFGTLDKTYNYSFTDPSYISIISGHKLTMRGVTGKFGLQYEQKLGGDISMILGATYRLQTNMKGETESFEMGNISSVQDTIRYSSYNNGALKFADELGVGISVKKGETWSAEFNYLRSGWDRSGMDAIDGFRVNGVSTFSATATNSFRAGFEIVPNRNDIRYYLRRCAYRAGVYYDQSYYKLDGNNVNSFGLTLGMTLPVFKGYNGISIGIDMGQKGSLRYNNMVRERYITFVIGFNIHDIWFVKPRYE